MKIRGATSINGDIRLQGDKSISHRAAIIAAMAKGETRIENFSASQDCETTLKCLAALGVPVRREGGAVIVTGVGTKGFRPPTGPIDCGNSGTTMRLIAGVLAGQVHKATLTGDASLVRRPMRRIIEPLTRMGAAITSQDGRAPLTVEGRDPLHALVYRPDVPSAQVKSCILLAALNAEGETVVIEPVQTRDHTERMLAWFGVDVCVEKAAAETRISITGGQVPKAREVTVPGDLSSAAFFLSAAVCPPGSDLTLREVGINPTRRAVLDLLRDFGAEIEIVDEHDVCNEPVATLRARSGAGLPPTSAPVLLSGDVIANLIDEVPIIAVLGTQLEHGIEIRDAAELRVKESDRISAIVENLKRMGATVAEYPDGLKVERSRLRGARVDSFGDHRIAMAFAVAGLLADGETEVQGAECAGISFPGFFETLDSVVR